MHGRRRQGVQTFAEPDFCYISCGTSCGMWGFFKDAAGKVRNDHIHTGSSHLPGGKQQPTGAQACARLDSPAADELLHTNAVGDGHRAAGRRLHDVGINVTCILIGRHGRLIEARKKSINLVQASGFGPLVGGYVFSVPTSQARALLGSPRPAVLSALGAWAGVLSSCGCPALCPAAARHPANAFCPFHAVRFNFSCLFLHSTVTKIWLSSSTSAGAALRTELAVGLHNCACVASPHTT